MPPLTDNPRYERLALNLVAGMTRKDAMIDAGFAESTALAANNVIDNQIIKDRIRELQEIQAQTLVNTGAVATLEERKAFLTKVIRDKPNMGPFVSDQLRASHQLNLMEKVYEPGGQSRQEVKVITLVLNNEQKATITTAPHTQIEQTGTNDTYHNNKSANHEEKADDKTGG